MKLGTSPSQPLPACCFPPSIKSPESLAGEGLTRSGGLGACSFAEGHVWVPSNVLTLQKEFMKQVQTSGVLMVFSQAWIEELYHQVLERNMLGEAGYWGSPEDHSLPLITMLTG